MLRLRLLTLSVPSLVVAVALVATAPAASAAQAQVGLGTATSFAVLGGATVTNTGPSTISGDVGVSPGTAVVGFPPGLVTGGSIHAADALALQAQDDLTTAYNDAAGRGPVVDETGVDLGNQVLLPGVYNATSSMALTGTVTLNGLGDPAAVFIFQAGSTLISASNAKVSLVGCRPTVQRVLAGGQLGHHRHQHDLRRQCARPHLDHDADGCLDPGSAARAQRPGLPGHQRHQQAGVRRRTPACHRHAHTDLGPVRDDWSHRHADVGQRHVRRLRLWVGLGLRLGLGLGLRG